MTMEEAKACKGCSYLSKTGTEPTCDYLAITGKMRGCDIGVGCTHNTRHERHEDRIEVIRQMTLDGKTDTEIGAAIGLSKWTVRNVRQQAGIDKHRGGSKKRMPPLEVAKVEPPTIEDAIVVKELEPKEDAAKGVTFNEFMLTLDAFIPDKVRDAELYIDGCKVGGIYGYSVTIPDGKLVVDLLTMR